MTTITAGMVKELREKTGAGMMDCKSALQKAGDMEGAIKFLREKGLARAAKKTSRVAAEGLVCVTICDSKAALIELNCETDFVARNEDFQTLAKTLADTALSFDSSSEADPANISGERLGQCKTKGGEQVDSLITEKIATIGEKIALRRFAVLNGGSIYGAYIHGAGSIGVVVECNLDSPSHQSNESIKQAAKDLAMHVAAANPAFVKSSQIPQSFIDSEKEIFRSQVLAQGKPENMVDKIVDGKMAKHLKDFCLLDQPFVKNPDLSVQKMLAEVEKESGAKISVTRFVRFKVGEGLEKKADDFAEEVKKMTA